MRIMGKRQLGELEPAELVVAVLISDLASHPLQDLGTPLLYGLIPVLTLLCFEVLISAGINRSIRFRSLVCGKPSIIIENGSVMQAEMRRNRFTIDELTEELRKKNITDIATVKYAILETDGTLSPLLYPDEAPATPKQLHIAAKDISYPVIVINDGRVLSDNLRAVGKNEKWLDNQLRERKAARASDVYLMSVDGSGNIFYAAKEKYR